MTNRVYTIEEIAALVAPIAKEYGVGRLMLFGSYARGDATPESDIDLRIADRGSLRGLFRLSGFQLELTEKLNKNVDVLPTDSLSSNFMSRIEREEIAVYELLPKKP
jgi:predicted nucleotidyltransferase